MRKYLITYDYKAPDIGDIGMGSVYGTYTDKIVMENDVFVLPSSIEDLKKKISDITKRQGIVIKSIDDMPEEKDERCCIIHYKNNNKVNHGFNDSMKDARKQIEEYIKGKCATYLYKDQVFYIYEIGEVEKQRNLIIVKDEGFSAGQKPECETSCDFNKNGKCQRRDRCNYCSNINTEACMHCGVGDECEYDTDSEKMYGGE